jgi:hypothetical protein
VVQVDIGPFVEAVVRGFAGGRAEVVVHICKAGDVLACIRQLGKLQETDRVKSGTSPCCGGILLENGKL